MKIIKILNYIFPLIIGALCSYMGSLTHIGKNNILQIIMIFTLSVIFSILLFYYISVPWPGTRFVSHSGEVCISNKRGFYLSFTRFISFETRSWSQDFYYKWKDIRGQCHFCVRKNNAKNGNNFIENRAKLLDYWWIS